VPRQLVIIETCDVCAVDGVDDSEATYTLVFDFNRDRPKPANKKANEVLLCETHHKQYVTEALERLLEASRPYEQAADRRPGGRPTQAGETPAAAPARASKGPSTTPAANAPEGHMAAPLSEWPSELPAPTVGPEGETVFTCPECTGEDKAKATYSTRERKRPQHSIRLHMRQLHGWEV